MHHNNGILPVFVVGAVGTTAMTLFSHVTSNMVRHNFREPSLLAQALSGTLLPAEGRLALPAGWLTHYLIGCPFALVHYGAYRQAKLAYTTGNGLALGMYSGLTAILCWYVIFKRHPSTLHIAYKRFYLHLIVAHMVYGVTVAIAMKLLRPAMSR